MRKNKPFEAVPIISATDKERQQRFLTTLKSMGTVVRSMDASDISDGLLDKWKKFDPEFRINFEKTKTKLVEQLEASAYNRALGGDTLLTIFLLKKMCPEKYDDRPVVRGLEASLKMGGFASVVESAFADAEGDQDEKRLSKSIARRKYRNKQAKKQVV